MSSIPVSLFVNRLAESNLLSDEQLVTVRTDVERVGGAAQTEPLARRLVREGLLTDWQVQMLVAGRSAFFLGKYKLLDLIGHGGMGVVFKAEHAGLGRIVAIKVMAKERVKNPAVVARFHREIQAAAVLNNQHVVVAYDADCVGDTHFLVMEYVDGVDLGTMTMSEGPLHVEEACEYIRQAAIGLQHAHEKGMVHRDIKPSNLMLTHRSDGEPIVKILDMGLARFETEPSDDEGFIQTDSSQDTALTQIGQVMGTPDYMAPEQAWNTKAADIRSDIYSLGCTLYQLLTARLPFAGKTAVEKVMAKTKSDAPLVSTYRSDVSDRLDWVVSKMLDRDPANRFQTPAEVVHALEPFSVLPADVLTPATPSGPSLDRTPVEVASSQAKPEAPIPPRTDSPQETSVVPNMPAVEGGEPAADDRLDQFLENLATKAAAASMSTGRAGQSRRRKRVSQHRTNRRRRR